MSKFEVANKFTAQWEGGYVNHPNDPGGATNYGVSFRWLRSLGLELGDVDGDGDIDVDDIKHLTPEYAAKLFKLKFYDQYRLEELPLLVAISMYDSIVNMGPRNPIRMLQQACNFYPGISISVDGGIGDETIGAVRSICTDNDVSFVFSNRVIERRLSYYLRLTQKNKKFSVFLKGWRNRCNALRTYLELQHA